MKEKNKFEQIFDDGTNQNYNQKEQEENIKEKGLIDEYIKKGTKFADLYEVISDAQSKGGMGKAILCRGIKDNKYYVLKKAKMEKITEAFKREIEFTLKLDKHPNIVYTQTAIREKNIFYMVMELVKKQQKHPLKENWWFAKTLTDVINNNEIDLETAFNWTIEFCRGMQYLNLIGLKSHQDIKPDNIFITEDNHIKIADFGLASFEGIFYTGGTKKYFSPEHGDKEKGCDVRSDIYSFGIVMYEMFNSVILATKTENIGKEIIKSIKKGDCKYCGKIIEKCLQENPDNRYQTFVELEEEIVKESKKYLGENFEVENKQMTAKDYFEKAFGSEVIGNYEQAIELYTKAIKLNPRYKEAYSNIGDIYFQMGEMDSAMREYDQAIKLDNKNKDLYYMRGTAKSILQEYDAYEDFDKFSELTIEEYNKAIEVNPKDVDAYERRGYAKADLKQYKEAINDYNKAIEIYKELGKKEEIKKVEEKIKKVEEKITK